MWSYEIAPDPHEDEMSRLHRRQLLKGAAAASAGAWLQACSMAERRVTTRPQSPPRVVFLRFGGGVRFDDVFGPASRCLAPTLRSLATEGTLYTSLWNDHLTRHDCATRYLLTGLYGKRFDSNEHSAQNLVELESSALVHEVFRRNQKVDERKTLAIGVPEYSAHPVHGAPFRAASFARYADRAKAPAFAGDASLRTPGEAHAMNGVIGRLLGELEHSGLPAGRTELRERIESIALSLPATEALPSPFLREGFARVATDRALAARPYVDEYDVDACLTDLALAAMKDVRPDLVSVGFVTPDLAHRGAWRDYAAAVRALDREVQRVAEFIATDPYYRERTLLMIAPDTGRGAVDFTEHEKPFAEPTHRQLFLAAWGHGANGGRILDGRREQIQVASTIAAKLGFEMPHAELPALEEIL